MFDFMRVSILAVFALTLSFSIQAEDKKPEDHKPVHGGTILEVGEEAAHIEFVHDEKAGKITLYIMGGDAKTALNLKEAPKLNLKTKAGNKQLETKGADATWTATDEALKDEPSGRIALTLPDGKKYNVAIEDKHDHK